MSEGRLAQGEQLLLLQSKREDELSAHRDPRLAPQPDVEGAGIVVDDVHVLDDVVDVAADGGLAQEAAEHGARKSLAFVVHHARGGVVAVLGHFLCFTPPPYLFSSPPPLSLSLKRP